MAKKKNNIGPRIKGTYFLSKAGYRCGVIRSKILRRRLQILVHSCIYYDFGDSLVTDDVFDDWSKELVDLQETYPYISSKVDYHKEFRGFDGSTGFDLPYRYPEIRRKAEQLLSYGG